MLDANDIEIIEVDDEFNNKFNNDTINELNNMKNILLIQGQYPSKQVDYDSVNNVYVLSEPGFENLYVNVVNMNGVYQILPVQINADSLDGSVSNESSKSISGHTKTLSTLTGRLMSDERQSGFTNVLFFIFLAGLSVGMVIMMVLNFFI